MGKMDRATRLRARRPANRMGQTIGQMKTMVVRSGQAFGQDDAGQNPDLGQDGWATGRDPLHQFGPGSGVGQKKMVGVKGIGREQGAQETRVGHPASDDRPGLEKWVQAAPDP